MDGPHLLGAARAAGANQNKPKIDAYTLYVLYMALCMTIWMSSFRRPEGVETRYGPTIQALVTCFYFTVVTVLLQALLAIALSEKPVPSALPPPVNQWMMAVSVWMFGVLYYLMYAGMNGGYAGEPIYRDLIIAGVASVVSLAMTVYNMLKRPIFP